MILPIELIIIVDEYLDNHNISILNKLINKEITYANNLDFWKSKYLEKMNKLYLSSSGLDLSQNKYNSKYEYVRIIKQFETIKKFSNFLFWMYFDFQDYIDILNILIKYNTWKVEINMDDNLFVINKFKNLKEFNRLVYKENYYGECGTFYNYHKSKKLVVELLDESKVIKIEISNMY